MEYEILWSFMDSKILEVHKFGTLFVNGMAIPTRPGSYVDPKDGEPELIEIQDSVFGAEITWVYLPLLDIYIADRVILTDVSWDDLRKNGFVEGKEITVDGKVYHCRLPSTQSDGDKMSEWDRILFMLSGFEELLHYKDSFSWGAEADMSSIVKCPCMTNKIRLLSETRDSWVGFRPVLVAKNDKKEKKQCVSHL